MGGEFCCKHREQSEPVRLGFSRGTELMDYTEVGSNAREGMDPSARVRASRQRKSFLLPRPLYRQLPDGGPRLKVGLPTSKIQIKSGTSHFK